MLAACSFIESFSEIEADKDFSDSGIERSDATVSDSGSAATGGDGALVADGASGSHCQRSSYKLCTEFEDEALGSFGALFQTVDLSGGGTLSADKTVFREGSGSLFAMVPAGAVGVAAARRAVSITGFKAIAIQFDIYPDTLPPAGDSLTLAFAQFANNTTSRYLSFNLVGTASSLAVSTFLEGSVGTAVASQPLQAGTWTRLTLALTMSPLTATRARLELTPDGGTTIVAIDQTLADGKNPDTGSVPTTIGAGIDHYHGTVSSPAYQIHFDNLSVDYP